MTATEADIRASIAIFADAYNRGDRISPYS
jgi:hypothetical protein